MSALIWFLYTGGGPPPPPPPPPPPGGGTVADFKLRNPGSTPGDVQFGDANTVNIVLRDPGALGNIAFSSTGAHAYNDSLGLTAVAQQVGSGGASYADSIALDAVVAALGSSGSLGEFYPILVAELSVPAGPFDLLADDTNNTVWLTSYAASSVSKIDVDDPQAPWSAADVADTVELAEGSGPVGVASDGEDVWVTQAGARQMTRINTARGEVSGHELLDSYPRLLIFDGTDFWTPNNVTGASGAVPISLYTPGPGGGDSNAIELVIAGIDAGPLPVDDRNEGDLSAVAHLAMASQEAAAGVTGLTAVAHLAMVGTSVGNFFVTLGLGAQASMAQTAQLDAVAVRAFDGIAPPDTPANIWLGAPDTLRRNWSAGFGVKEGE